MARLASRGSALLGVAGALFLAVGAALAQPLPSELKQFYEGLTSDNPQSRYIAREALSRAIAAVPDTRRDAMVAELLDPFPRQPWRVRLGIAIALAKQPTPWTATDANKYLRVLYQELQSHSDETLGPAIDDAIANAKGYYRDAIIDYNNDRIEDLNSVVAKFQRMADDFPQSKYAANALFYQGQYLTRAYLLGHPRGRKLVEQANAVLGSLPKRELANRDLLDDASYYLALNRVLLDDNKGAIAVLRDMEAKSSTRDRIYVYQFYYSKNRDTVVDRSYETQLLARKTREYLEEVGSISPDGQQKFIAYLAKAS